MQVKTYERILDQEIGELEQPFDQRNQTKLHKVYQEREHKQLQHLMQQLHYSINTQQ